MINGKVIIYGGGQLGLYMTFCLKEQWNAPLFIWDKNVETELLIKGFAEVRYPNRAKVITPFVGKQVDICEAFGFAIPEG